MPWRIFSLPALQKNQQIILYIFLAQISRHNKILIEEAASLRSQKKIKTMR